MHFIDLDANYKRIKSRIDKAVLDVISSGKYILGPAVGEFEKRLAEYIGVKHVVSCANGTDALLIPLMAHGIGRGDAVFCPSFTFAATAEVVALAGAEPVFIDIEEDTYNIDADSLLKAIDMIKAEGRLTPKAIITVDLFGLPADHVKINKIAKEHNLLLIEDAAQSIGGKTTYGMCGSLGDIGATSFYPAKPLGCYGDGGAIFTNDDNLVEILRSIAFHGKGSSQYDNVRVGLNSRLDTIQAAILIEKLNILEDEMEERSAVASYYNEGLKCYCKVPEIPEGHRSAFAQYTISVEHRDELKEYLKERSIATMVYYPKGLHLQKAYCNYPRVSGGLPVTERFSDKVISLPMHPYLSKQDQDIVIEAIISFYKKRGS